MIDSPFERQTEDLRSKNSQNQLQKLFRISTLSKKGNFHLVQNAIDETLNALEQKQQKDEQDKALISQIMFLGAQYEILIENNNENCKKYLANLNQDNTDYWLILRYITLNLCCQLNRGQKIQDIEIAMLKKFLAKIPQASSQVLFKLTGSKSLQRMKEITIQQIETLSDTQQKKAMKLEIAADWKYIIDLGEEGILFKKEATLIWKKLSKPNQLQKCELEQRLLRKIISQNLDLSENNTYTLKLINLRNIVKQIFKFFNLKQNQLQKQYKKLQLRNNTIKFMIPLTISTLKTVYNFNRKSQKKSEDVKSSDLKLKEKMEQKVQIGENFHQKHAKNNYIVSDFLLESKFMAGKQRIFAQKFGILNKLIKSQYRQFFNRMLRKTFGQEKQEPQQNK